MHVSIRYILCCCLLAGGITLVHAQDSTKKKRSVASLAKDVYRNFLVKGERSQDSTFLQRSEESYQRFAGKVIRHIIIRNLSFGENVLRSEEHTSELQSPCKLVCRLLLEKKKE